MNFEAMNRTIKSSRRGRNVFALIAVLLLISNVFQAQALSSATRSTVLVPSRISDGMVANGAVDIRYLEAISLDAVYAFYNLSPANASYSRDAIERVAAIRQRSDLLKAFDEVADDMRERRITTTFFVSSIDHDFARLELTVHGTLNTFLETELASREERSVRLRFVREANSARLAFVQVLEDSA